MVEVRGADHIILHLHDDQYARLGAHALGQGHRKLIHGLLAGRHALAVFASVVGHGRTVFEVPAAHQGCEMLELVDVARAVGVVVELVHADGVGVDLLHHVGDELVVVLDVFVEDSDIVGHQTCHIFALGVVDRDVGRNFGVVERFVLHAGCGIAGQAEHQPGHQVFFHEF